MDIINISSIDILQYLVSQYKLKADVKTELTSQMIDEITDKFNITKKTLMGIMNHSNCIISELEGKWFIIIPPYIRQEDYSKPINVDKWDLIETVCGSLKCNDDICKVNLFLLTNFILGLDDIKSYRRSLGLNNKFSDKFTSEVLFSSYLQSKLFDHIFSKFNITNDKEKYIDMLKVDVDKFTKANENEAIVMFAELKLFNTLLQNAVMQQINK